MLCFFATIYSLWMLPFNRTLSLWHSCERYLNHILSASADRVNLGALTSVGALDFDTGVISNVVTGLVSPRGMAFVPER
jgi:hypothetical protein